MRKLRADFRRLWDTGLLDDLQIEVVDGTTADVGFEVFYDLPNLEREALITVSFTFKNTESDDSEYTYAETLAARVAQ